MIVKYLKPLLFILICSIISCTLNADQEKKLNAALVTYVNSHNNGAVLSYVGATYPAVVAFYKNQSDSIFQAKFDLSDDASRSKLWDGTVLKSKSKDGLINLKYRFKKFDELENKEKEFYYYAISQNNGETWFFLEEIDYRNEQIVPLNLQLIMP